MTYRYNTTITATEKALFNSVSAQLESFFGYDRDATETFNRILKQRRRSNGDKYSAFGCLASAFLNLHPTLTYIWELFEMGTEAREAYVLGAYFRHKNPVAWSTEIHRRLVEVDRVHNAILKQMFDRNRNQEQQKKGEASNAE